MTEISTFHMAFAFIFTMAVVISHCVERYQRNRARNLEIRADELAQENASLRDALFETRYLLDDAQREAERCRTSNSYLIREAESMSVRLAHQERELAHLRSVTQRRRDALVGSMMLHELVHVDRKMRVYEWSRI